MMKSGEATGNIDETLERLANTFEKQFRIKKKVQSSLTYPAILLVITIGVVFFLLMFIVPTFVATFEDMGAELPLITVVTVAISNWLTKFWWVMLALVLAIVVGFNMLYKSDKQFYYMVHYAILRLPVFGPLLQKTAISRLTRTLSSLFSLSLIHI